MIAARSTYYAARGAEKDKDGAATSRHGMGPDDSPTRVPGAAATSVQIHGGERLRAESISRICCDAQHSCRSSKRAEIQAQVIAARCGRVD